MDIVIFIALTIKLIRKFILHFNVVLQEEAFYSVAARLLSIEIFEDGERLEMPESSACRVKLLLIQYLNKLERKLFHGRNLVSL